ncbi:MAG TPA: CBS domain-containing protein [Firmicutes bacterium]|nr:CBS domain-containing protein [Bacillota bacterium]
MNVKDIMTTQVAYVDANATVAEAAKLMQKHNIGSVPVCEGTRVVGIITDRDIVVRNVAHGKSADSTPVREVMTSKVHTVSPETDIQQVAGIMAEQQVRRLPVVEGDRLVGMISLGDLATEALYDVEVARTLGEISEPSRPFRM